MMVQMKKLLSILIIFCFYSFNSQAFFSTAIFKKDKELNFNHFFNFDITKYEFEDHEKIIGEEFEKWDGDPKKKSPSEIDFKKIPILVDGKKQELKLRKFNEGLWLQVNLNGYSCVEAKKLIPKRFISENHYQEYLSDFSIIKMKNLRFSYDYKNSRITFQCLDTVTSDTKKDAAIAIRVSSKDDPSSPQIIPMKMITCRLDEAKTNIKNEWSKMKNNSFIDFYIKDDFKILYDTRMISAGKNQVFNNDLIHTVKKYKYSKSSKQTFYKEYKIDRTNGSFSFKRKDYDPKTKTSKYLNIPDGIIVVDYIGSCEKKTEKRKF